MRRILARLRTVRWRRVAFVLAAPGVAAAAASAVWIAWPLPASVLARDSTPGVTIQDRNGLVLRSTRAADGSNARWVAYSEIDPDVINAFVAVEDRRFWEHHGVDLRALARAARDNLFARHVVSGASTITMQLARLLHPAARNLAGKATQVMYALRLEAHLGKQQILEQYLNRVQLGQGTIGIGAASTLYFRASASELSIGQAATLAGLAHAPSRDNPHASATGSRARRDVALNRMRQLGFVTREDVAHARDEPLVRDARTAPFLAPHFTTRVLSWTADDRENAVMATANGVMAAANGVIRTSVDLSLQQALELEVRYTVDALHDRGVMDAAVVVLDNRTGEVLAWVGSPDFWAPNDGQTDMVVSARQPGSALKPFLYGLALDRGFTAASVIPDIPKSYATATGPYAPRNYDRQFRGPVRTREALASSYNVPAVELASRVGVSSLLHTLQLAGFESLRHDATYYGLGLALGNGDVTLIELANGFRALANGGVWHPWTWRAVPVGADVATMNDDESTGARRIVSPMSSAIVLDILQDPVARIPGFGIATPFDFPFPVAVKTGTSRHFTDNWAVATTRGFTVAVWAGNFSGHPMEGVSGVTGAGPLLHRAVMAVARYVPPGVLTTPAELGAVSVPVCRLSGMLATRECAQVGEWFAPGTAPTRADDWERNGQLTLPDEYSAWSVRGLQPVADGVTLAMGGEGTRVLGALGSDSVIAPDGTMRAANAEADSARLQRPGVFRIISPLDGDKYSLPPGIEARYATIPLRVGGGGGEQVVWWVDGKAYASERWALAAGAHIIEARSARGELATVRIVVER